MRINIDDSARDIARRLHTEMKASRIMRVDFEMVRAAVAGWAIDKTLSKYDTEALENLTLRKFVEGCA